MSCCEMSSGRSGASALGGALLLIGRRTLRRLGGGRSGRLALCRFARVATACRLLHRHRGLLLLLLVPLEEDVVDAHARACLDHAQRLLLLPRALPRRVAANRRLHRERGRGFESLLAALVEEAEHRISLTDESAPRRLRTSLAECEVWTARRGARSAAQRNRRRLARPRNSARQPPCRSPSNLHFVWTPLPQSTRVMSWKARRSRQSTRRSPRWCAVQFPWQATHSPASRQRRRASSTCARRRPSGRRAGRRPRRAWWPRRPPRRRRRRPSSARSTRCSPPLRTRRR